MEPQGKDSPWSGTVLGVAALIALPFVLLAWLLVQNIGGHIEHHRQMENVLVAFRAGLALMEPVETMRDLAPARVYLGTPEVESRYRAAAVEADAALKNFLAATRALGNESLASSADRLQQAWGNTGEFGDEVSNTVVPFDHVNRFGEEIHATLAGLLFVSDMSAGSVVTANEPLIVVLDTLHRARHELGLLRAIAVYTALRDGYLSSADAEYLDNAWSNLERLTQTLHLQGGGLDERLRNTAAPRIDLLALEQYLIDSEEQLILSSRVTLAWRTAWDEGEIAMGALRLAGDRLVNSATTLVDTERRRDRLIDSVAAIGLAVLYGVVTALGVMFYRTRYAVVQAKAESRARSLFLARMSHEIRTPLNGVIGLAELLSDTDPTPRQREYIDLIASAGRSLISLVNDILDHARIEAGKMSIERTPVDIRALVAECAQVFSLRAGQNRTLIFCLVEDEVPARVLGDPVRIRQVLLNLIANAVKFTERGRVEICVERSTTHEGASRLRVEVRDTGIGLTPAEQQKLFNLFTQASSEVTRRYGGTGLGLSISRELVQLMGGHIGVYSGVGPGSVFWFELPLVGAPGPLAAEAEAGGENGNAAAALLVDPDGHLARAVAALPEAQNRRIAIALNEYDVQRLLETRESIGFAVLNGVRHPDQAFAMARLLKASRPAVRIRLLVAVGSPEAAAQNRLPEGVDEVVAQAVFGPAHLLRLLLPPAEVGPVADQAVARPAEAPPARPRRVLVAEDNPVNQLVTRGMLRRLGMEADVAADGREAVEHYIALAGGYDLVLMDLDMPVMDGNAAARAIRRLEDANGWSACPILALSAHAQPEYANMAREAGMDGQLVKPVSLAGLDEALRRYARHPGAAPPDRAGRAAAGDFSI